MKLFEGSETWLDKPANISLLRRPGLERDKTKALLLGREHRSPAMVFFDDFCPECIGDFTIVTYSSPQTSRNVIYH